MENNSTYLSPGKALDLNEGNKKRGSRDTSMVSFPNLDDNNGGRNEQASILGSKLPQGKGTARSPLSSNLDARRDSLSSFNQERVNLYENRGLLQDDAIERELRRRGRNAPIERDLSKYLKNPLDRVEDINCLKTSRKRWGYTDFMAAFPSVILWVSIITPLILMILLLTTKNLFELGETEFKALFNPGVRSVVAFDKAVEDWNILLQSRNFTGRERTMPHDRLFLQFTPKNSKKRWSSEGRGLSYRLDMLSEDSLRYVQRVEEAIVAAPLMPQICWTNNLKFSVFQPFFPICVPPASVTTLYFPDGLQQSPQGGAEFEMSGRGKVFQGPRDKMLAILRQNERYKWFGDGGLAISGSNVSDDGQNPVTTSAIRTQFTLGFPVVRRGEEISKTRYTDYVDALMINIVNVLKKIPSNPDILVTFGGPSVVNGILRPVLNTQLLLTIIVVFFAFLMIYLQTGSLILTMCCVGQMTLTYLSAFYIFSRMTSQKDLTLMSAISMIVTVCFDTHSIIWVHNAYQNSGVLNYTGRRNALLVEERLGKVFATTVPCIAISHVVAIIAFGSLILSPVPSLKQFSVLMMLNTCINFFLNVTFWPSVMIFRQWYFVRDQMTLVKQRRPTQLSIHKSVYFRDIVMSDLLRCEEATKCTYEDIRLRERANATHASKVKGFSESFSMSLGWSAQKTNRNAMQQLGLAGDFGKKTRESDRNPLSSSSGALNNNSGVKRAVISVSAAQSAGGEGEFGVNRRGKNNWNSPGGFKLGETIVFTMSRADNCNDLWRGNNNNNNNSSSTAVSCPEPGVAGNSTALLGVEGIIGSSLCSGSVGQQQGEDWRGMSRIGGDVPFNEPYTERLVPLNHLFQIKPTVLDAFEGRRQALEALEKLGNIEENIKSFKNSASGKEGSSPISGYLAPPKIAERRRPTYAKPARFTRGTIKGVPRMKTVNQHIARWDVAATKLDVMRSDELCAFVTEHLVMSLTRESLIWDDNRYLKAKTEYADYGRANSSGDLTPEALLPVDEALTPGELEEIRPKPFCTNPLRKLKRWISKPRGKGFSNSREDLDAYKLNYAKTHAGVSFVQRFMQTKVLSCLSFLRYALIAIGVIAILCIILFAFFSKEGSSDPWLIDAGEAIDRYEEESGNFPIAGPCDYCSFYQSPRDKLPPFSLQTLQICAQQGKSLQMVSKTDKCGVCNGDNKCLDCAYSTSKSHVVDGCGSCVLSGVGQEGVCNDCDRSLNSQNGSCWPCARSGKGANFGGGSCDTRCDESNCPRDRGACNAFTGQCECFYDDLHGYFADSSPSAAVHCTACAEGFYTSASPKSPEIISRTEKPRQCTTECEPGDPCGCVKGRCTLCSRNTAGKTCSVLRRSTCRKGTLSGANGTCECPVALELDSNISCTFNKGCSYHGVNYTAGVDADISGCGCAGQWMGPRCQFCRCANGGKCDALTGRCVCAPGWSGVDCTVYSSDCLIHGRGLPTPYAAANYLVESCVPVLCPMADVIAGKVCAACASLPIPPIPLSPNQSGCVGGCKGYWSGPGCNVCSNPWDLPCDEDGSAVGCDGEPSAPPISPISPNATNVTRAPKIVDRCGVCGGSGACLGCDGIAGSSLILDKCGVCGGLDECLLGEGKKPTVTLFFVWGLASDPFGERGFTTDFKVYRLDETFDISDVVFQAFLYSTCTLMLSHMIDLVDGAHSKCAWREFVDWTTTPEAAKVAAGANLTMPLAFPFVTDESNKGDLHYLVYQFALLRNLLSDFGFTTSIAEHSTSEGRRRTRLNWFKSVIKTKTEVDLPDELLLHRYQKFEQLRIDLFNQEGNKGNILHISQTWSEVIARDAGGRILRYSIGIGIIFFGAFIFIMVPNLIILISSTMSVAATIATGLLLYAIMGWEFGPIKQLGVAVAVAFSSQHVTSICVEYTERLFSASNPFLTTLEIREQAMRGALGSTAEPVLTSLFLAFIGTFCTVGSTSRVISRVGVILCLTHVMSFIFSMLFMSGIFLAYGPSVRVDLKYGKVIAFYFVGFAMLILLFSLILSGTFTALEDTVVEL